MTDKNKDFKDLQKQEAVKRIKMLKFHENVLKEFQEDVLNKSEFAGFHGVLFWLDDKEKEFIKKWEKKSDNLAYHIIKQNTEFGIMMSILYVSKHEEEWQMDLEDLENENAIAYCIIGTDETYGEYGSIGVRPANGGLTRTH